MAPILVGLSVGGALLILQCLLAAGLVCLTGLVFSIWSAVRARRRGFGRRFHKIASVGFGAGLLAAIILSIVVFTLGFHEVMMRTNSVGRLKGLYYGVRWYDEEHGRYPVTLEEIIKAERIHQSCLLAPGDRRAPEQPFDESGRLVYSSYAYNPGQGRHRGEQDLILAYEREPFRRSGSALLAFPLLRCVVYDDGEYDCLTDAEFEAAMAKDQKRRQELGWLTTQSAPGE